MKSREIILQRVKANQPEKSGASVPLIEHSVAADAKQKFVATVTNIGATVITIFTLDQIQSYITERFSSARNIISAVPSVHSTVIGISAPRDLSTIDIALLKGEFAVAENGAIWITDKNMIDRALPFICENLMLVVEEKNILPTLHEAYDVIGSSDYEYASFIAGPSKTADIEQSLVLGAHGPKTLTVFILQG
jgi:L-lactate dehydrogenase complex protein LldG